MRASALARLFILIVLCASGSARAESERERQARAVKIFESGEVQFNAGHFDAAATLFQEAWETYEDPAYILNIGLAFEKAQRWRLAVFWYDRFLAKYPTAAQVPEVTRRRAAAEQSREVERATVMVRSEPAGARALVLTSAPEEVAPSCATPCTLRVDPGPVALRIELGSAKTERSKSLAPGERWDLAVELVGAGPSRTSPDRTPSWVAWGLGGASLVTGVVFAALAQGSFDDAEALAARSPLADRDFRRFTDLKGDVRDQSLVADLGFAGALIGAAVGTAFWLTAEDRDAGASW